MAYARHGGKALRETRVKAWHYEALVTTNFCCECEKPLPRHYR
jgi:hypothetical protein